MDEIAKEAHDKANQHAGFKENVTKFVGIINMAEDFIGKTLDSYPPAALAWSGICVLLLTLFEPKAMREIKLFDTRKPYYYCSRIKTSASVCTILLSLAAYTF